MSQLYSQLRQTGKKILEISWFRLERTSESNIGEVQHGLEILRCGAPVARSVAQIGGTESQRQLSKWFLCSRSGNQDMSEKKRTCFAEPPCQTPLRLCLAQKQFLVFVTNLHVVGFCVRTFQFCIFFPKSLQTPRQWMRRTCEHEYFKNQKPARYARTKLECTQRKGKEKAW